MKNLIRFIILIVCFHSVAGAAKAALDREAIVARHRIVTTRTNPESPAQVGNGEFAFGVDITGLQTFVPFNTLSQWSWHSFPLPEGEKADDFQPTVFDTHGRQVPYEVPNPKQPELSAWLAGNPHRFNLGRIGLKLVKKDGSEASAADLTDTRQEVDLWIGIIHSRFKLEGEPVYVQTACHPSLDAIGVVIESPLVKKGQISVFVAFPYPDKKEMNNYLGDYDRPDAHRSVISSRGKTSAVISRTLDDIRYYATFRWDTPARFAVAGSENPHRFELQPGNTERLSFTCMFSQQGNNTPPGAADVMKESASGWKSFWHSGAAVDLSGSKDPRWKELERRIVLSQYVMRVNEAGSLPPQESGLVNNGWYGRFHFEMIWWHGVHYALWNRWPLLEKSLSIYQRYLPTSMQRAQRQGYKGARWPKCTASFDREWPNLIHATLIWQQPHPIYFAELDYRLHPDRKTLEKWKEVVFATADFMVDYAFYDAARGCYVLGPPVFIVSENTDPFKTVNPAFELGYWRYGLRVAQEWKRRLGLPEDETWKKVQDKLAPLPVENGLYVTYEGIPDMWEKFTFEHPALIGTYGMLPGDGVDKEMLSRTLDKVCRTWNFNRTWGWDFPMLAMAAARLGKPVLAIDMLLHEAPGFQFDEHGLCTGGPFPYFPSNGAFLTAIAMMCGGWDGSTDNSPGFPTDDNWKVKAEGFVPMQ